MKTGSVLIVAAGSLLMAACSSGPPPIKPGSPAFFWAVARESYRTGDLLKTQATLLELSKGDSEFTERARIWHLVVSGGVMKGLGDLADAYQAGSEITPARFRKEASALRGMAASAALEFTQAVYEEQSDRVPAMKFAFEFPSGSAALPPALATVSRGTWLADEDRELLQRAVLQRGVILAAATAVGRPGDPSKALSVFSAPEFQVPRETFLFGLAKLLYDGSGVFGPQRLDRPERQMVMCRGALETLRLLPETDQSRALGSEIQAAIKKIPGV